MSNTSPSDSFDDQPKNGQLRHTLLTARRLSRSIRPHWATLAIASLLMAAMAVLTLLEPRVLGWIVDQALVPRDKQKLLIWVSAFASLQVLRAACQAAQSFLFTRLGQSVMHDLRTAAWDRLIHLPVAHYFSQPVGKLTTRVTNDSATLSEMFSEGMVSVIGNVLVCLGTLIGLFWLDWRLSLISLTVFPILVAFAVVFSRQLNQAYRTARARLSELNANLAETLQGMKEVFLTGREELHRRHFDALNSAYTDAQFASTKVFAVFQPTITLCTGISMALALYVGGSRVAAGHLAVGNLVAYLAYILGLYQPVREIADKWNLFLSGMSAGERILNVLDWAPEEPEPFISREGSLPLGPCEGRLRFEDVWFAYEGENWVLRGVSFEIKPGQLIGVAGASGAGKTTLIHLMMRFFDPQKGRITLDGVDLKDIPRRTLRQRLGFVQQDLFLFSGTIAENLSLWSSDALSSPSAKTVLQWLEEMRQAGRLRHLSDNLDTRVEERGQNFSMGERQILAFARASLNVPEVWILDEATASVDSSTEMELEKLLMGVCKGKSTIVVAHRLATIQRADCILVFHKGTLVESGSHSELLAINGLYRRLWLTEEVSNGLNRVAPSVNLKETSQTRPD